ncbi:hypothetical protein ACLOJK_017907 [Asimina triloba]
MVAFSHKVDAYKGNEQQARCHFSAVKIAELFGWLPVVIHGSTWASWMDDASLRNSDISSVMKQNVCLSLPPHAVKVCFLHEKMRIVGLTGGIASGKSTVSNLFKASGIPVVDADVIARDVVRKGTGGWKKVVATFGDEILQENGEIDRAQLGQIVFTDPAKRQLLNRLLAPFISSGIFWEVVKLWFKGSKVVVLDIPLLFEAKMDQWTKPIIVIWVDPETQLQRLMSRDDISVEQAKNRINAQMSLDSKRTKADIVIDNSGSLDDTREQFKRVLTEVKRPLTWREFGLSRKGALLAFLSVIVGVMLCKNIYNDKSIKSH